MRKQTHSKIIPLLLCNFKPTFKLDNLRCFVCLGVGLLELRKIHNRLERSENRSKQFENEYINKIKVS